MTERPDAELPDADFPSAERLERLLAGDAPRDAAETAALEEVVAWRAAAREVDAGLEGRAVAASEALLAGLEGELADARRRRFRLLRRIDRQLVIRVVAASLLVHLAALPVLAWFAFVKPEPDRTIVFQRPTESPFDDPTEAPPAPLPESLDAFGGEATRATERSNRERVDAHTLTALAPTAPAVAPGTRVEALVADRLARLAEGAGAPPAALPEDGLLERALLAATLLDRWLLEPDARPALGAEVSAALAFAPPGGSPVGELLSAARGRAAAYGVLEGDDPDPGPVDLGAWADAVLAAAEARGAATPELRALLAPLR